MLDDVKNYKRIRLAHGGMYGFKIVNSVKSKNSAIYEDLGLLKVCFFCDNKIAVMESKLSNYKLTKKCQVLRSANTDYIWKKKNLSIGYKKGSLCRIGNKRNGLPRTFLLTKN